jgi:hypothetical protein
MAFMGRFLLLSCLFSNFIFYSAYSQRCDSYSYNVQYPSANTSSTRLTEQSRTTKDTTANEVITIPVVIHVLYNTSAQNISQAQILSQLTSLNNDYRNLNADASKVPAAFASLAGDARITFCLAKTDNAGKTTTGIIRKYTPVQSWSTDDGMKYSAQGGDNAWDPKRYLNIWVCNLYGRSLGYSSLPGSQLDKDGVVIQYDAFGTTGTVTAPFNKGRTATHEVAHWLGLKHIWGDGNCGDDGIADTPPQQSFNNGCPSFPHKTTCSINSNGDMFMNFMDFTDDACMYMFSKGQGIKMRSMFAAGAPRNSLLNSTVCDINAVQRSPLPIDTLSLKRAITLYPNPAVKIINIDSKVGTDLIGKTLKICNSYGEIVLSQRLTAQKNMIDVSKLSKGVYIAKIGSNKEKKILVFVKQ